MTVVVVISFCLPAILLSVRILLSHPVLCAMSMSVAHSAHSFHRAVHIKSNSQAAVHEREPADHDHTVHIHHISHNHSVQSVHVPYHPAHLAHPCKVANGGVHLDECGEVLLLLLCPVRSLGVVVVGERCAGGVGRELGGVDGASSWSLGQRIALEGRATYLVLLLPLLLLLKLLLEMMLLLLLTLLNMLLVQLLVLERG